MDNARSPLAELTILGYVQKLYALKIIIKTQNVREPRRVPFLLSSSGWKLFTQREIMCVYIALPALFFLMQSAQIVSFAQLSAEKNLHACYCNSIVSLSVCVSLSFLSLSLCL